MSAHGEGDARAAWKMEEPQTGRMLLPLFVGTIFISAALLFSVQPMFAKMVLPRLGGSPGVWSVAMVVFQALLLAGYAYAHALMRWLPGKPGILVHILVTIAAALTLPFTIRISGAPPVDGEIGYLIAVFVTAIGPAFFALSANGPLLQAWFAHTGHADAKDPYFLYAASNVGSFLALFAYPFVLEPALTLGDQSRFWTAGFWLLLVLLVLCALTVSRTWIRDDTARLLPATTERIDGGRALSWIFLSAVPSALLVAVTAQISTDIASAPLLWVIPLALYLLTFVVVFQGKPLLPHRWMLVLHPILIAGVLILAAFEPTDNILAVLTLHLAAFFVTAMVAHDELVRKRPSVSNLTLFYLAMSLGGMLGGIFAGLIAPRVFSWVAEYPILIVLGLLCRPRAIAVATGQTVKVLRSEYLLVTVVVIVGVGIYALLATGAGQWFKSLAFAILIAATIAAMRFRFAIATAAAVLFALTHLFPDAERSATSIRSFFGVHKIFESADGRYRLLSHGTTIHGAMAVRSPSGQAVAGRPEPLAYYFNGSPMAQALLDAKEHARQAGNAALKIGVIGLGAGSLACYSAPGERWRYFEIDRDVLQIARDRRFFRFLPDCQSEPQVVIGDARLTLVKEPDGQFDFLLVDAFSSDAIPVHLITREAIALYKTKLKPDGLLVLHISNRHLELASVVAGVAAANTMAAILNDAGNDEDEEGYRFSSTVAVIAQTTERLVGLRQRTGWEKLDAMPDQRVWTDDYSNILGALLRRLKD